MATPTKAKKIEMLNEAIDLLNKADALMQQALGHHDDVYYIHCNIENSADDLTDIVSELEGGKTGINA